MIITNCGKVDGAHLFQCHAVFDTESSEEREFNKALREIEDWCGENLAADGYEVKVSKTRRTGLPGIAVTVTITIDGEDDAVNFDLSQC